MAVFSGNPADRATGNVAPGSVREASRVGTSMSNGTTRNNNFGGQTSRAEPGGGGQVVNTAAKSNRLQTVNTAAKGNMLQTVNTAAKSNRIQTVNTAAKSSVYNYYNPINRPFDFDASAYDGLTSMGVRGLTPATAPVKSTSTGPVSRGVVTKAPTAAPKMKTGAEDYKSIVPGKVTMTAEKVPFAQKNPSLAKYLGGTVANPKIVTQEEITGLAKTVAKSGVYVSAASPLAKTKLPPEAQKTIGMSKPGYGSTTVGVKTMVGIPTVTLSYPKSVATGKAFGTYTAGPKSSTGPVSRGVQPKSSTGPVSRGVSPAPRQSTGPVSRGIQPTKQDMPTVSSVRKESQKKKAATVSSRVVKDGYVYTRVGNRLQNFGPETDRDTNRIRRKQK